MLKNMFTVAYTIADKVYHFTCDQDSPINHVKEALFQFQGYVKQIEDNIAAQAAEAAKKAEEAPKVESIPEQPKEG